jgi:hypothetical protein
MFILAWLVCSVFLKPNCPYYPDEIKGLKKIIFFAFSINQILSSNDCAAVGTKG